MAGAVEARVCGQAAAAPHARLEKSTDGPEPAPRRSRPFETVIARPPIGLLTVSPAPDTHAIGPPQPIGVGYIPRHSSIRVSAARCLRFRFARAARIDSRCRHGRQCRRSTLSRCRPPLEHIPDSARATSRARRCADTRARPAAVLCVFLSRSHCDRRHRACVIARQSPAPQFDGHTGRHK